MLRKHSNMVGYRVLFSFLFKKESLTKYFFHNL
jgi:hypothetical protein